MTTQTPTDRADADLRALVAGIDPEAGEPSATPDHLLGRVLAGGERDHVTATVTPIEHRSFLRRHWQGTIMAAASVLTVALAAGTVLPGLSSGSNDSLAGADMAAGSEAGASADSAPAYSGSGEIAAEDMAAAVEAAPAADGSAARSSAESAATVPTQDEEKNTLVRSASMLVGTDDITAARDKFVALVLSSGGRITSETVITDETAASGYGMDMTYPAGSDMGVSYPYPWYPSGPGTWLTVQVPADRYEETVEAARDLGEVVQLQQSSYDVGQQITDVDSRIAALESSIARLETLMDDANSVSDVIKVETAISERQAELDSLKAQQRDLANETAMSSVSLTLMSPDDASQTVDPQPAQSWWERFLDGLEDLWSWLGQALLIVSPLLIGAGIIWWVRRRQRRAATRQPAPADPRIPPTGAAPTSAAQSAEPTTTD